MTVAKNAPKCYTIESDRPDLLHPPKKPKKAVTEIVYVIQTCLSVTTLLGHLRFHRELCNSNNYSITIFFNASLRRIQPASNEQLIASISDSKSF